MALIVTKNSNPNLWIQIHKYNSGNPPSNFSGGLLEVDLGVSAAGALNYDIDWLWLSDDRIYLVAIGSGHFVFELKVNWSFLTITWNNLF